MGGLVNLLKLNSHLFLINTDIPKSCFQFQMSMGMISKVEHRVLFVYESMIHGLSFSLALDVSFGNS